MPPVIHLRPVIDEDLPVFYEQQLDAEANYMAAFTPPDPTDRAVFDAHWVRIRNDAEVINRTIEVEGEVEGEVGGEVAGYIARYYLEGNPEVGYWLGRDYWGQGIATAALRAFLDEVAERPLQARVAFDNTASRRVLEKCGFRVIATGRWFSNARRQEIDELILALNAQTEAA